MYQIYVNIPYGTQINIEMIRIFFMVYFTKFNDSTNENKM